jgi:hypothetical protein
MKYLLIALCLVALGLGCTTQADSDIVYTGPDGSTGDTDIDTDTDTDTDTDVDTDVDSGMDGGMDGGGA